MYAELTGDSKKQEIKSFCDNKLYVNWGTRFMSPRPFVTDAFNFQKELFKRDMNRLVK